MSSDKFSHALVLRYRDPAHASEWLCQAFGFSRSHVAVDGNGHLRYAQLSLGHSLVMVGRVGDAGFDELMKQPEDLGGAVTNIPYFVIDEIDAHFVHAGASGAEIAIDLSEYSDGGRGYTCKDPEGHVWSFGSYNPWTAHGGVPLKPQHRAPLYRLSALAVVLLIGALSVAVAGGWLTANSSLHGEAERGLEDRVMQSSGVYNQASEDSSALLEALTEAVSREAAARDALHASEQRLRTLADQLEMASAAIRVRDEAALSLQQRIDAADAAKAEVDARADRAQVHLDQERRSRAMAERATDISRTTLEAQQKEHLASEQSAREQYAALTAKLVATEQAYRLALSAYEELVREKATSSIGTKATEAERLAPPARAPPEPRGTVGKRDAKPGVSRSASAVEPRLDRARRRCAEVRRNPDEYEQELVQLCRAL